jgi:hypothetical protein
VTDQEILDNVPPKQGKWPDCNQVDSDGKWSHRQPLIRSLADIARIVEIEHANEGLGFEIIELEKDIAFLQSCVNSGETATKADRPSKQAKALREQVK